MSSPIPGLKVTTPYGRSGRFWAAGYHTGDDYGAPKGTPVYSTGSGVVKHVGWGGWGLAYGAHVIVEHSDGIRSMYAHLSRTVVRYGDKVSSGTYIGNVGSTGNSTGPHLHYEERVGPYGYFNNRKPRNNRKPLGSPTYLSKLHYGQRNSNSVKNLQRALNNHIPKLGKKLPVTGYYGPLTDAMVRRCQKLLYGRSDKAERSFVGPKQAKHLKLSQVRP